MLKKLENSAKLSKIIAIKIQITALLYVSVNDFSFGTYIVIKYDTLHVLLFK